MLEHIIQFDKEVFLAINQGMSNAFFDWFLPILRNRFTWSPLYLFLIIFFIKNYGKTGVMIVMMSLVTFALSDLSSSRIIKNNVKRVRPCNDVEFKEHIKSRVGCGSGFSFTSSHATNHFAIAFFWIVLFRRRWKHALWLGITWAAAISFSQVYVGVHYPLDILCGALLGTLIGWGTGHLFKRLVPSFFEEAAASGPPDNSNPNTTS